MYRDPLWAFTVSPSGIRNIQLNLQHHKPWLTSFWQMLTHLGGGNELKATCTACFFYGRRPKFFYFLFVFAALTLVNNWLKLVFHQERPFMADNNVKALTCNDSYGSPSGHAQASAVFSIVMILDIFHGSEDELYKSHKNSQTT